MTSCYLPELFSTPVGEELMCDIGGGVLNECMSGLCGHKFCKGCIGDEPVCPVRGCRADLDLAGLEEMPYIDSMIRGISTICRNSKGGCNFNGGIVTYSNHVEICKVQCGVCGIHTKNLRHHHDSCTTTCKYCSEDMFVNDLEKHLRFDCFKAPPDDKPLLKPVSSSCPFSSVGCASDDLHIRQEHVKLLLSAVLSLNSRVSSLENRKVVSPPARSPIPLLRPLKQGGITNRI